MKEKTRRLKIAFDVDDTIINFTEHTLRSLGQDPYAKTEWGWTNFPKDIRDKAFELFSDSDFIKNVPISQRLKEDIKRLTLKHEIFFITATYPEAATARILYLRKHFPTVKPENIIIAGNKNVFNFDIFFDDRFENLSGDSTHNILVNRHWNKGITRFPIVRSFDDMLEVIKMVEDGCSKNDIFKRFMSKNIKKDALILIQGHTGSGKTYLLNKYIESGNKARIEKVKTSTTRPMRESEDTNSYNFLTEEEFIKKIKNNEFIEYTKYLGNYYGTEKVELDNVYKKGNRPLLIVESEGIESFNKYTNNIIDIYLKRDMQNTVEGLLKRDGNLDRLNKLADELKVLDQHKCRCSITNADDINDTLKEFAKCIEI